MNVGLLFHRRVSICVSCISQMNGLIRYFLGFFLIYNYAISSCLEHFPRYDYFTIYSTHSVTYDTNGVVLPGILGR